MSDFSPGPWRVRIRPPVDPDVIDAEGAGVAIQGGGYQSDGRWADNARLIAAAPEILEALRDAVIHLRDWKEPGPRKLMQWGALIDRIDGKEPE